MLLLCPHCRSKFELEQAFQEVDGRKFVELLTSLPPATVRPLYNYIQLFTPEKHALTWTKALKLAIELAPMIKEQAIKRNGKAVAVSIAVWVDALTYLVETPPATLTKPLKSNGYLFTVLIAKAEQAVVAAAEKKLAVRQSEEIAIANAKRSQEKADKERQEKAPMNPEFKKQVMSMLAAAKTAVLTPEQKAEQLRKYEEMKAGLSAEDQEKIRTLNMKNPTL